MSPDPVLAAIDATLEAVQPKTCACGCGAVLGPRSKSMYYAGEACQHRWMRRGKPSTASGPGWVSPPGVRYELDAGGLFDNAYDALLNLPAGSLSIEFDTRPLPRPFSGPAPSPFQSGSVPAETTLSNDVPTHRVDHPLRIWWKALRRKVNRG